MLHLFSGIYNLVFHEVEFNILLIGHEAAGKSTLLEQLKYMYHPHNITVAPTSVPAGDDKKFTVLPAGIPQSAPPSFLIGKRIRPTVGMNYALLEHRCAPLVATLDINHEVVPSALVDGLAPAPSPQQVGASNTMLPLVGTTTRLKLWDLGGQRALRTLWGHYLTACHAIVYVVDSTLYHQEAAKRGIAVGAAVDAVLAHEVYKPNRETLEKLLLNTDLHDVPFLILGNKCDVIPHLTLAQLQEALDVAEIAAFDAFYGKDNPSSSISSTHPPADGATTNRKSNAPQNAVGLGGGCGFGHLTLRLAAVSSLNGRGVTAAMDWLVLQLHRAARTVDGDVG